MRLGWHHLDDAEATETATATLDVFGERVETDVQVPAGPTHPRRMLPVFRALAATLIDAGVARAQTEGKSVSCARGCGACCRQMVPVSPSEAHAIREVIDALPEAARASVEAKFADAGRRIEASGLAPRLRGQVWDDDAKAYSALALAYFQLGIPCPFLDDEGACSIYLDRPTVCREYLVTSSPEHCARPGPGKVQGIPLPGQVSRRLSNLDRAGKKRGAPWVPLALAPAWADANPEGEPTRTGMDILREFFESPEPGAAGSKGSGGGRGGKGTKKRGER